MKLSFLITVHNETTDLKKLLAQIENHIIVNETDDEVVILDDSSDNPETQEILKAAGENPFTKVVQHPLHGHFGEHKTYGSRQCSGDYIVQLDADEYLADILLLNLSALVEANSAVELFRVPRVNIVRGLEEADAKRWGWRVIGFDAFPDLPIINWPDFQSRIYKNNENIRWTKALHEVIIGANIATDLPLDVNLAIIHDKTIERQNAQNEFYNKNWSRAANMGNG